MKYLILLAICISCGGSSGDKNDSTDSNRDPSIPSCKASSCTNKRELKTFDQALSFYESIAPKESPIGEQIVLKGTQLHKINYQNNKFDCELKQTRIETLLGRDANWMYIEEKTEVILTEGAIAECESLARDSTWYVKMSTSDPLDDTAEAERSFNELLANGGKMFQVTYQNYQAMLTEGTIKQTEQDTGEEITGSFIFISSPSLGDLSSELFSSQITKMGDDYEFQSTIEFDSISKVEINEFDPADYQWVESSSKLLDQKSF